jgi:hypothetical protein
MTFIKLNFGKDPNPRQIMCLALFPTEVFLKYLSARVFFVFAVNFFVQWINNLKSSNYTAKNINH